MRGLRLASFWALVFFALLGAAEAQDRDSQSIPDRLRACLSIDSESARLSCYDALARDLAEDNKSGDAFHDEPASRQSPPTIPEERATPPDLRPAEQSETQAPPSASEEIDRFGLPEPRSQEDRPEEITLLITEFRRTAERKYLFISDAGQVWQQTDTRVIPAPDPPFTAEISRNFFGSYFLKINGERPAIRVERLQ